MKKWLQTAGKLLPTGTVVIIAVIAAMSLYARNATRPWTRFGQVRAYVVEVAPRVGGRVVEVAVQDNQSVKSGDLLFRVNPEPYELSVRQAERNLDLSRQEVAQLTAAVTAAKAVVDQYQAAVVSAEGTVTQAKASLISADAAISEAQAGIDQAQATIDQTQAGLDLARIELKRAEKLAKEKAGSVQNAQIKAATVTQNEAALVSVKAGLEQAKAGLKNAEAGRQEADAQVEIAKNSLLEAQASVKASQADLAEAEANLGEPGDQNVRIRQSQVALDQANLNLSFTSVYAPSDGYVTNLQVAEGAFANSGQPLLAFVKSDSYWVYAFFRETQLKNIDVGDTAEITLMSRPEQPLAGKVDSIGQAIYPPNIATSQNLIPQIQPTFNWVRLAQRVPVRIHFDDPPPDVPLVVGTTASVSVESTD